MQLSRVLCALVWAPALLYAQGSFDPAGALSQYAVARFVGSGSDSIQAMTSDAAGNVYVAGTTTSLDLPMKNAAQPAFGEALLMRSLDNGATWQKVNTGQIVVLTVAPDPTAPQTLFVGAPDGIYETTDGGQTWRQTYTWNPAPTFVEIAIDPANPRLVYAIEYSPWVFLASADGGETWQVHTAPFPFIYLDTASLLWVDPNGSGTVVLGFALSRDQGATWQNMANITPYASSSGFTVPVAGNPGWVYAATAYGAAGSIYMSTDWGTTWTQKLNPGSIFLSDLLVDPDQPGTLYGVSGLLYISNNGAAGWYTTKQAVNGNLAAVSRNCAGGALLAISYQGIVASPDFGATWQPPQLSNATALVTGPGCSVYAIRSLASDAFVAKLSPTGDILWSTFLGGAGADAAVGIALDASGNVYVAGNTSSADFPSTRPRTGQQGSQNIFAAKFDSGGHILYSEVIGGEGADTLTAMAAGSQGDVYLAGRTSSSFFPATAGVFQAQVPLTAAGFAVKLAPDGAVVFASYLANVDSQYRLTTYGPGISVNGPLIPIAVTGEQGGSMLVGGHGATLSRIAPDGSSLTPVFTAPGQIYSLQTDAQGNIYAAGQTDASISLSGSCYYGSIYHIDTYLPSGDIYVLKLQQGDLRQSYSARITGVCQSVPGAIQPGSAGNITLGIWSWGVFEQHNGIASAPSCAANGPAGIARLTADPSKVVFSSYVDMCGEAPAVAAGGDGFLFAGVTRSGSLPSPTHAAILRLPVKERPFVSGLSLQ